MNKCKTGKFFFIPNKFWEVQLATFDTNGIDMSIRFNTKGDHAGLRIDVQISKLTFLFTIYDSRHWDWDNDCWEKYE